MNSLRMHTLESAVAMLGLLRIIGTAMYVSSYLHKATVMCDILLRRVLLGP